MSEQKSTPRPWKISNYRPYAIIARDPNESTYEKGDDKFPRLVHDVTNPEDAYLIVRAVNAHDGLLEAVRWLTNLACGESKDPTAYPSCHEWIAATEAGKAAIAKAEKA